MSAVVTAAVAVTVLRRSRQDINNCRCPRYTQVWFMIHADYLLFNIEIELSFFSFRLLLLLLFLLLLTLTYLIALFIRVTTSASRDNGRQASVFVVTMCCFCGGESSAVSISCMAKHLLSMFLGIFFTDSVVCILIYPENMNMCRCTMRVAIYMISI